MKWAGHIATVGENRGACRILVWIYEESDYLGDPGVVGSIILN
jgi:hypothetical protein